MPGNDDAMFGRAVKNLLAMKPQPHKDETEAPQDGQSESLEGKTNHERKTRSKASRGSS